METQLLLLLIACMWVFTGPGVKNSIVVAQAVADRKSTPVATPSERRRNDGNDDETNSFRELCQWETFEAECPSSDEVLLITGAVYGRYRLGGRCIQTSYGRMSCGRDALDAVGARCSGRRRCTFPVTILHGGLLLQHSSSSSSSASSDTCPMELTAHLLVKYTCLKVAQCDHQQTHSMPPSSLCDHGSNTYLQATTEVQYITNSAKTSLFNDQLLAQGGGASVVGAADLSPVGSRSPSFQAPPSQQQCGSTICPWKLHAEPGQRINITLIHFSTTPLDGSRSTSPSQNQVPSSGAFVGGTGGAQGAVACHRFASVTEPASANGSPALPSYRDLTACGNDRRNPPADEDVNSSESGWKVALSRGVGKNENHIYLSDTNSLRLEFYPPHGLHIIIRYQAVGCRTLSLLPDSIKVEYVSNEHDRIEKWRVFISCLNEHGVLLKWRLRCAGSEWVVEEPETHRNQRVSAAAYRDLFKTCSAHPTSGSDETDSAGMVDRNKPESRPSSGILVVIGLGIALGVAVGFSLLLVVLRCIRHDSGDVTLSSEVTEAGTHVQYWKTPVAVKYDAYESRIPPPGGSMIYDDNVRQTELFSEAPSPAASNTHHLDRGSTTLCCRPTDYFRPAPDNFDGGDFRVNAPSLSSVPGDRHFSSRDAMASFSMTHHVHCDEHVYEPTAHESMMFVNLPASGGGGRTLNMCSGH